MSIKGSQTEKNLLKAFAGESQAKNRYTFFAKVASKEGFEQIGELFYHTAIQEEQHAKEFFKLLEGNMVEITASYPAGKIGNTLENLEAAAIGENEEWVSLYPEFANIAEKEGFIDIANKFRLIAKVEAEHEQRYLNLLANLKNKQVFKKPSQVKWTCRKCGHIHFSDQAPIKCPICSHPQAYFEIKAENY